MMYDCISNDRKWTSSSTYQNWLFVIGFLNVRIDYHFFSSGLSLM